METNWILVVITIQLFCVIRLSAHQISFNYRHVWFCEKRVDYKAIIIYYELCRSTFWLLGIILLSGHQIFSSGCKRGAIVFKTKLNQWGCEMLPSNCVVALTNSSLTTTKSVEIFIRLIKPLKVFRYYTIRLFFIMWLGA